MANWLRNSTDPTAPEPLVWLSDATQSRLSFPAIGLLEAMAHSPGMAVVWIANGGCSSTSVRQRPYSGQCRVAGEEGVVVECCRASEANPCFYPSMRRLHEDYTADLSRALPDGDSFWPDGCCER